MVEVALFLGLATLSAKICPAYLRPTPRRGRPSTASAFAFVAAASAFPFAFGVCHVPEGAFVSLLALPTCVCEANTFLFTDDG